jgi:hypothetical protein
MTILTMGFIVLYSMLRLIIFDTDEELLLTALHLKPALPYAFILNSAVKEDENGADTRKHKGF